MTASQKFDLAAELLNEIDPKKTDICSIIDLCRFYDECKAECSKPAIELVTRHFQEYERACNE